ncbi:MAG: hypothetical protein ACFNKL_05700 [Treponema sp.]
MKIPANFIIENFFRTFLDPFSPREFTMLLSRVGLKSSIEESKLFLENHPLVFPLVEGLFITRAAAFTNKLFSFKPTKKEFDKGILIAGCRTMPFTDPEVLSCELTFRFGRMPLERKTAEFDSGTALDFFELCGEEFAVQFIGADPANKDINLYETDFMLPNKVNMSGFSLDSLIKEDGLKYGDRIFCKVTDWDEGIVDIAGIVGRDEPFTVTAKDVEREKWYSTLEEKMLKTFDTVGPCSSIEEQLAIVFGQFSSELCVPSCGSLEEFFKRTKKIDFETFGVETRLWRKGEKVPAIGDWNRMYTPAHYDKDFIENVVGVDELPESLVNVFLKDHIYSNTGDLQKTIEKMYPYFYKLPEEKRESMLLHLKHRHDILRRKYNKFADSEIRVLRHKAVELYCKVFELLCAIDTCGGELEDFPQQPLVILSQIYGHVCQILELTETDTAAVVRECNEIMLSIEGMEFNFEEISGLLWAEIDRKCKSRFMLVK